MFTMNYEIIAGVPVLHVAGQNEWEEKLPVIFFIHGFTSAKEHNLHYAYLLAKQGFRVILPEVYLHGERFEEGVDVNSNQLYLYFWDMVIRTINELAAMKHELMERDIIDEQRIGMAGVSMGGIVTLGALTQYKWIKVAASLMGCPAYEQLSIAQIDSMKKNKIHIPFTDQELDEKLQPLAAYDLSNQPEYLANRPLLFWHGKADPVVPYHFAYEFYCENITRYNENPGKLKFILDSNAGHKVTRNGVLETVQWFDKFL